MTRLATLVLDRSVGYIKVSRCGQTARTGGKRRRGCGGSLALDRQRDALDGCRRVAHRRQRVLELLFPSPSRSVLVALLKVSGTARLQAKSP